MALTVVFAAPPEVAAALAAVGYDVCSTASNHSLDQGITGLARTLDALDAAGVRHAGTARSEAEAATPTFVSASPLRVLDATAQPGDPRLAQAAARTHGVARRLLDPAEAAVVVPVQAAG